MPDRRRDSPLRELRQRTQSWKVTRRTDTTLGVDPRLPSDSGLLVYCPLLETKMCGNVDCGRCPVLLREIEERQPDYVWVCSTCTGGLRAQAFWSDGTCEVCGTESCVRVLAVPLE